MNKKLLVLIVVVILIILCPIISEQLLRSNINKSDISGRYSFRFQDEYHLLELKPDGTYLHRYNGAADKNEVTNTDRWEFNYENGTPLLTFHRFLMYETGPKWDRVVAWRPGGDNKVLKKRGVYSAFLKRYPFKPLRIVLNEDSGYYFSKED